MSDVTPTLNALPQADAKAAAELLPQVYTELRRLAAAKMAHEAPGHTLQATALVHEAWLRLSSQEKWTNRAHFIAAAAESMRRILVENARRRLRLKRGSGERPVELPETAIAAPAPDEKTLQVHDALASLEKDDPAKAEIVKLRFFAGLQNQEIANLLGISERTVRRQWELARLVLFNEIKKL